MALIMHMNHENKHSADEHQADDFFVAEMLCISTYAKLQGIFVMQAIAPRKFIALNQEVKYYSSSSCIWVF